MLKGGRRMPHQKKHYLMILTICFQLLFMLFEHPNLKLNDDKLWRISKDETVFEF